MSHLLAFIRLPLIFLHRSIKNYCISIYFKNIRKTPIQTMFSEGEADSPASLLALLYISLVNSQVLWRETFMKIQYLTICFLGTIETY